MGDDLADVRASARAYEATLTTGDTAGATAFFDDAPETSRLGPEGAQLDLEAVRSLRARTGPTPAATWLHDSVRLLGEDAALHVAVLERGGDVVQRTQVWVRRADGWRITHAHVSRPAPS